MLKSEIVENFSQDLLAGFVGSPLAEYVIDDPHLDTDAPLDELVWAQAARTPDAIAFIDGAESITYAELQGRAEHVAGGLIERGRQRGDRILIHLNNSATFMETFLGVLRAGCVPVLTLPGHRFAELSHLARLSGAVELVGEDAELLEQVAAAIVPPPKWHSSSLPPSDHRIRHSRPGFQAGHPALLLVSGGTTGLPKLIARTHQDYRYNVKQAALVCAMTSADVYLAALPLAHNFPLGCPGILGALTVGATVVSTPSPSPDVVLGLIEKHHVSVVAAVPSLALLWAEATDWEGRVLDSLRLIQVGGARFSPEQAKYVDEKFGGKLQQVFGMAEGLLCFTPPDADDRDQVHKIHGYPMSPLDQLRIGADGGLEVKGPYTIRGYYRAPEANRISFSDDGWYRSGDRVSIHDDGAVVVQGRIKDVVIKAGENVDCVELEELLIKVPGVAEIVIVGAPDEVVGEIIVAAVVPEIGHNVTLSQLRSVVVDAGLAHFKQPDRLLIIDRVPLTVVGKPDRKVVAAWAQEAIGS